MDIYHIFDHWDIDNYLQVFLHSLCPKCISERERKINLNVFVKYWCIYHRYRYKTKDIELRAMKLV